MSSRLLAALALWLAACGAPAQTGSAREPPASVSLGPRLLDYAMECVDPRDCRIECFQNGVKIVTRAAIGQQDEIRLVASAGPSDEVTPRWIEIRPFNGNNVQTLLLTGNTFCNLQSLVISTKNRP